MPALNAVDLSHWNTVTDWDALAASDDIVGVIHKATEGSTYKDPDYTSRKASADDVGLLWGAYHFLKHGNVQEQMAFFLSVAKLSFGSRAVIDYEDQNCTLDDLRQAVAAIQGLDPSLQIAVYGGDLLKRQLGTTRDEFLATSTSLWLAHYTAGTPSWPSGTWPVWSLWQYTDGQAGGTPREAPGIGACDCNTFNGPAESCALWFGPVEELVEELAPKPQPAPTITVDITVPDGVNVLVTVNGELIR